MRVDLVLDGHGPLYGQLARALAEAIARGRLRPGERLPSTRELALRLGLSRRTVNAAYERLRSSGRIRGCVGSGSFVEASPPPPRPRPAASAALPAQSAYSRRGRQVCTLHDLPGRPIPGVRYAFQYSLPNVNPRLSSAWQRTLAKVAPYVKPNYPPVAGLAELREAVAEHVARSRGVVCSAEDVFIVHGTQQAIALAARVLVEPGETVVLEEPHYFGARQVLQMHGAEVVGVPVDGDGLRVDRLPAAGAKLIYLTPSHQFPTGAVLSPQRRRRLLDYAARHGGWIVEDDYDGEFRSDASAAPSLQSMDRDGRVLYVGTFTKVMFPALRLAYLIVPPALREDVRAAKWAADFGTGALEQSALAHFIRSGAYDRHLRTAVRTLAERRAALRAGLARIGALEVLDAHAGMHLMAWVRGLAPARQRELLEQARRRGLGLYTVEAFYLQPPPRIGLMLGFSALPATDIARALRLLEDALLHVRPPRTRRVAFA